MKVISLKQLLIGKQQYIFFREFFKEGGGGMGADRNTRSRPHTCFLESRAVGMSVHGCMCVCVVCVCVPAF